MFRSNISSLTAAMSFIAIPCAAVASPLSDSIPGGALFEIGSTMVTGPQLVEWQGGKPAGGEKNWGGYGGGNSNQGNNSNKGSDDWEDEKPKGGSQQKNNYGKNQKSDDEEWQDSKPKGGSKWDDADWENQDDAGKRKKSWRERYQQGKGSSSNSNDTNSNGSGNAGGKKTGGTVTMACASKCKTQCMAETGFVVGQPKGGDKFNACVASCRPTC